MAYVYGTSTSDTLNALDGVTNSADKIFGLAGNDNIYGLGGNDEIMGGHGADRMDGGTGIDTAIYSDSGTAVSVSLRTGIGYDGTAEGDTLLSIENLTGSAYGDVLEGNDGANVLRGLGGDDAIFSLGGDDIIYGGDGKDYAHGQAGSDTVYGEAGNDSLTGGDDNDLVYGGIGNDRLEGDAGNDALFGGDGDDGLHGGPGNDVLRAESGSDFLHSDFGTDTLVGGTGGDRFLWAFAEETGAEANTADVIVDFNFAEGDRIDLHNIDADALASGNQALTFIGNAAFSGAPGEINYIHANGDTLIQLQTGTSPDAEAVIRLAGILTPEAGWFAL